RRFAGGSWQTSLRTRTGASNLAAGSNGASDLVRGLPIALDKMGYRRLSGDTGSNPEPASKPKLGYSTTGFKVRRCSVPGDFTYASARRFAPCFARFGSRRT